MGRGIIIGLDLAKQNFQVHGSGADVEVLFRKKLRRAQVLAFFAERPRSPVAMEARTTAHDWGREIGVLGHEVDPIPAISVKIP